MKELIEVFPDQLHEALLIGNDFKIKSVPKLDNILICGLGGSGIGGSLVKDMVIGSIEKPLMVSNSYQLPAFVNNKTLFIACSYSGNTEETIEATKAAIKTGAKVVVITSGGKLEKIANSNKFPMIKIPGGLPPRACIGYSFVQILYVLYNYKLISQLYLKVIKASVSFLEDASESIKSEAKKIVDKIYGKTPVIYISDAWESIAIRWRQQLNENSKILCWHNKIPEMNHNELVGWKDKRDDLVVLFLKTSYDYSKNTLRMKLNEAEISNFTKSIVEINAVGGNRTKQALYLLHLGDWISYYLAEKRKVDATEVNVINRLKSDLTKK